MVGNSSKGQCGKVYREARFQAGMIQGRNIKWEVSGLKTGQRRDVQGNVATFGATSRRSREDIFQHRDVPKRKVFQRHDVPKRKVFQHRDVPENVKNQRRNVPKAFKINAATLESHVATF